MVTSLCYYHMVVSRIVLLMKLYHKTRILNLMMLFLKVFIIINLKVLLQEESVN